MSAPSGEAGPPPAAASEAIVGGYVVLERSGSLWGVAGRQVRGLGRLAAVAVASVDADGDEPAQRLGQDPGPIRGQQPDPLSRRPASEPGGHPGGGSRGIGETVFPEGLRLAVPGGELAADRVLAVVPDLRVWPAPGALRRFGPEGSVGLAVYAQRPVLVIDGEHPPALLRSATAEAPQAGPAKPA